MTKSIDVIVPVFNRDPTIVEYVINDFLKQDIDRIIIANTGDAPTGLADNKRIIESHGAPLPDFYPGYTRNMGAVVSSADVQIHTGADIITLSGDWSIFRGVADNEIVSPGCHILSQEETVQALAGTRQFPSLERYYAKNTATIAMTKHSAINLLHGPFCWAQKGWGGIDPDLKTRALGQGFTQRWIELATAHLYHKGGCEALFFGDGMPRDNEDFKRNVRLINAKKGKIGWWNYHIQ